MMWNSLGDPKTRYARYLPVSGVLAFVVLTTLLMVFAREPLERIGDWGYPGIFVVMLADNATIVLPLLGHAVLVYAAQSLDPILLGVIGGLGATIGELTGYILGRTGRQAVSEAAIDRQIRRFSWLRPFSGRLFGLTLFVFAATPLIFDVAGVLAGTMRFPVWRFLAWVGLGKIVNTVGIAVASRYAIDWLQRLVGQSG